MLIAEPNDETVLAHSYEDMIWLQDRLYRLHDFSHPSFPSPVTGLTADILILTALIGYYGISEVQQEEGEPKVGFELRADGQMAWREIVEVALGMQGTKGLADKRTSVK
jgi:coenzyme A diphosphatase NUDT7